MTKKIIEKYEDLSAEQRHMIRECKHNVLRDLARDLAKEMNGFWLQQLINELKLQMAVKDGIFVDDYLNKKSCNKTNIKES